MGMNVAVGRAAIEEPLAGVRSERRLRIALASLLLYFGVQTSVGLAWDIEWHSYVGRDAFLTPPHALLYSGVAAMGLVCVVAVLLETVRYHRGTPGVDDASTLPLFGVFRAPLGFYVAGFGMLALLVAAPLDNYWHELYGIDVTLWAPFHMMGLIGGLIGSLGVIYAFAAEWARGRRLGLEARGPRVLGWSLLLLATLFMVSALLRSMLVILSPARGQAPTTDLGPVQILTLPVGLAFSIGLVGVTAAVMTQRRWAATVSVVLGTAFLAMEQLAAPELVRVVAAAGGYTFRLPSGPQVDVFGILIPVGLLVSTVLIDAVYDRTRRPVVAALAGALPAMGIGTWIPVAALPAVRRFAAEFPDIIAVPPVITPPAVALGLLLAVAAAALSGWLGGALGAVLRVNER